MLGWCCGTYDKLIFLITFKDNIHKIECSQHGRCLVCNKLVILQMNVILLIFMDRSHYLTKVCMCRFADMSIDGRWCFVVLWVKPRTSPSTLRWSLLKQRLEDVCPSTLASMLPPVSPPVPECERVLLLQACSSDRTGLLHGITPSNVLIWRCYLVVHWILFCKYDSGLWHLVTFSFTFIPKRCCLHLFNVHWLVPQMLLRNCGRWNWLSKKSKCQPAQMEEP